MLLQIDGTMLLIIISFIAFAFAMNKIFYLPMRRVIEERNSYISNNVEESNQTKLEAKTVVEEYHKKIHEARLNAKEKIESLESKAKEEKKLIVSKAANEANEECLSAKKLLNEEKLKTIEVIKNEVAPIAQQIISKILGNNVAVTGVDFDKVDRILRG